MHGCSNAYLVYGFNMGDREYIIDCDYLESEFPDIYQYALDVVKNYLGEAIYGISCGLNDKTGQVFISDEDKEQVNELYDKYIEYLKDIKELEAPLTSGETATVDSEFVDIIDKEKSGTVKSGRTKITIPKSDKEEDIQKFIINQIETFLGIIETA